MASGSYTHTCLAGAPLGQPIGARRLRSVRLCLQPRRLAAMKRGARPHPRHTAVVHLESTGVWRALRGVCVWVTSDHRAMRLL